MSGKAGHPWVPPAVPVLEMCTRKPLNHSRQRFFSLVQHISFTLQVQSPVGTGQQHMATKIYTSEA